MLYRSGDGSRDMERSGALGAHLAKVYWWMTFALAVSGLCAWTVGLSPGLTKVLIANRGIFILLLVAEIGLVLGINIFIRKLSAATASALFILYSALNGITLSTVFLVYTQSSIALVFGITAATFAAMATVGSVTKKDLGVLGNILFMALIGLIIASVVNFFLRSAALYWICSYAGVLIFVGLTAYDAQKIKRAFLSVDPGDRETIGRLSVIGALELYLDFVNLFLYLLRIFGRRR